MPQFVLYGKCGTFQKYTGNAVPTTNLILLQYRWYRDWYRTTAFSVDPKQYYIMYVVKVKIPEGFEEIEKFKECQLTSVGYRSTTRILELSIVIRIQTTEKLQFITIS